ncbi:FixH family protein [soil metagenome]
MSIRNPLRVDDDHPFTGKHMLAVTLAFFGVIIAVNVILAVAATGTFPGLVVENSYVASQNYNELLASGRAQADAGWRMEIAAPDGKLEVSLVGRAGTISSGLAVTALAGRPSSTQSDRTFELAEKDRMYRAAGSLPPGQWDVDVEARRDGVLVFRELRRVYVEAPSIGG